MSQATLSQLSFHSKLGEFETMIGRYFPLIYPLGEMEFY